MITPLYQRRHTYRWRNFEYFILMSRSAEALAMHSISMRNTPVRLGYMSLTLTVSSSQAADCLPAWDRLQKRTIFLSVFCHLRLERNFSFRKSQCTIRGANFSQMFLFLFKIETSSNWIHFFALLSSFFKQLFGKLSVENF